MKSKYPQFKLSLALLEKEPLKLSGKLPPEFLELEPDGMIESIYDIDYKLDAQMISCKVTDDLRAEILLELPTNILCSEDCKGLCPHCGVNLNESTCNCGEAPEAIPSLSDDDSPWSALDQLTKK